MSNDGDAPFQYTEGPHKTYFVMCNGEIYNCNSLKKAYNLKDQPNDTSYIFPLFDKLKKDLNISDVDAFYLLNQNLTGSEYALMLVECIDNKPVNIYLSVDTSSVRPLFYYVELGICYFSSLFLTRIDYFLF